MTRTATSSATVPAPWTPLRAVRQEHRIDIAVQGRTYRYAACAALPSSIETNGAEILAAPMRLAGRLYGEEIHWESPYVSLLQQDESRAVLCGACEITGVIVSNSVKIDYDGMMRFDLAITPYLSNFRQGAERAHGLESLWIDIPLKAEYASLYTYWPLETGGVVSLMEPVNSNRLPAEGLTLAFKPFLWLGNEECGVSWFAESDKGWQPADAGRAIEVIPGEGTVTLRLHLLDSQPDAWRGNADSWYKPNAPVTISFGLQATPVKPVCTDALAYRMVHLNYYEAWQSSSIELDPVAEDSTETVLDRVVASGANVVVLHEAWNSIQNYWVSDQPEQITATVAACHARGLKVLPYFGYELSTLAPEWAEMADEVLIKSADGRYRGGWQRLPSQRDYMVCYQSAWQQRWLDGIAWMMDAYGFDGVYLDGATMPSACANAAHGCGYRRADGVAQETYPIFAVRRLMQRLYEIVTAREGIVTAHQSSCCLTPTLGYCHTYWDGEHIGGAFQHDEHGDFPLAVFRAEFMGHNFGIQSEFLSGQPEALAYTLIHNVMVRPGIGGMLDAVASIWKAFAEFGAGEATWLPYWRNAHLLHSDHPQLYASAYLRDTRLLLAVANLSAATPAAATIQLTPSSLGHADYTQARDAVSGEACAINANRVSISCAAMGWRLIEVS